MECQLPQLFFERLAFADIPEIERQPLHRRIVRQIAADALDHAAPRAPFDTKLDRADRPGARRGDFGQEQSHSFAVFAGPQLRKTPAGDIFRLEPQGALARGRHETQNPVGGDDHDDVGGVRYQRGVSLLDHARRSALAQQCIPAQDHSLADHEQQCECEHDHGHHGRRPADVATGEIHQHQKRREHRRIRQRTRQGV